MDASDIDSGLWHAIAGISTPSPSVNTDVYYFPQGHIKNSNENHDICNSRPILCKVLSVRYLCKHSTDQAFVKYILFPIHKDTRNNNKSGSCEKMDLNDIVYFSKVLTPSDNGGFSVPRFCANSIFPRLNFSDDPPVQTLKMFDAHQNPYDFRHIYRGTPRRHLLTTGWSKFVKRKSLVEGDSVLFMQKRSNGRLFIGARRLRFACGEGLSEDPVREEIENARRGRAFEVVYFPRMGMSNFVVRAEKVEGSMGMEWKVGMRVKMVAETEDSSRMAWFQGSIERVGGVDDNGSPWGMIEVAWDEPEILQLPKRVSPWQVESAEPPEEEHHSLFPPPSKKLKAPMTPRNVEVDFSFPDLNQSTSSHNSGRPFSINMQRASLDPSPAVSDSHNGNPYGSFIQLLKNGLDTEPRPVSTLNVGSSSRSENVLATYSFQLFGQTIHTTPVHTEVLSCGNGERRGMRG